MEEAKRYAILENPSLEEALQTIRRGVSRRRTVLIVGRCTVDYEGRASSKLDLGERVIILKSDGSALVHRPRDYAPVNWQPPGSIFRTRLDGNRLIIRTFRRKESEVLEVKFESIIFVAIIKLVDSGEFHLYASEEDMKQAIILNPSILEEGFRPITSERPVEPGFIDILGVDGRDVLTVVEIKRNVASRDAVLQLKRYVDEFKADSGRKIRGILVAPELARGSQKMLAALNLEFKALSPKKCAEILKLHKGTRLTKFLDK
jgi:RecB family endonuclease NucS